MTMHSVFLKQHDGIIPNPVGQLSSASVPWWSGLGSQTSGAEPGLSKGNTTQFTIFPVEVFHGFLCVPPLPLGVTIQVLSRSGHLKASDNGEKSSKVLATFSMQSTIPESHGRVELGYAQPLICGKYPYGDQFYGLFSSVGPQITGRIMLPLDLTTDDGPIYVNAKQYHGIIRRRISRAKAEAVNKALKVRKPYLHLSRHLHAMRRPRGCGGRFLNTKTSNCSKAETETKKTQNGQISQYTDSQNSEVVQSDSGNLNSPNEVNGRKSSLLGTEVTSIFSGSNLNHFSMNQFRSPVNSLSQMTNSGHDFIMFGNWV